MTSKGVGAGEGTGIGASDGIGIGASDLDSGGTGTGEGDGDCAKAWHALKANPATHAARFRADDMSSPLPTHDEGAVYSPGRGENLPLGPTSPG